MVYYFTSNVIDPPATIYVGKDKFESPFHHPSLPSSPRSRQHEHPRADPTNPADEELIKFGLDCDIW